MWLCNAVAPGKETQMSRLVLVKDFDAMRLQALDPSLLAGDYLDQLEIY